MEKKENENGESMIIVSQEILCPKNHCHFLKKNTFYVLLSDTAAGFGVPSSSTYQQGDQDMRSQNRNLQSHQQRPHVPSHNHQRHHPNDGWSGQHETDDNSVSVPNIQHHYPTTISSSASSSSPRAQSQQLRHHQHRQDQMSPPHPQEQTHVYSKSPKDRQRRTGES